MSTTERHLKVVPPEGAGPEDDVQLTLMDHLRELRTRLIYSVYALTAGFIVTYHYSDQILAWVMKPIRDSMGTDGILAMTHPTMGFFVNMRVAGYAAAFLTSPFLLYQFYRFVAPGLYRREKALIVPFVVLGVMFFVGGGLFGRYIILPFALDVLIKGYSGPDVHTGVKAILDMGETSDFVMMVLLAFGIIFELPLVLTLLARIGIVSSTFLAKYRRHAIVLNTIIAAVLTPTGDAFNLALMAIPLVIFYELGIIGARIMEKQRKEGDSFRMPDDEDPPATPSA